MAAAYRTLELTLISAKDLKDVNLLGKMDVYAEASLSGDPRSRQRTRIHVDSGPNPTWNQTLRFTIPADPRAPANLHVVLRAEKKALGDKDLGEVHVPLKELLENARNDGPTQPQFVSYQVRTINAGKPKGVINLSYKLGERVATQPSPASASYAYQPPPNAAAYPPPHAGAPYPPPPVGAPYPPHSAYPPQGTAYPPEKPPKSADPPTAYPPSSAYPAPAASEKPAKSSQPVTAYPPSGYPAPAPAASEKPAKSSSSDTVTAYPAAPSSSAAPYQPPQQPYYGAPQYGAPPPYGYAPPPQYGYAPPPQQGYGYPGYGYPPAQQVVQPQKKKKSGMGLGLGAGLIGGAIGGLILGDIVSDAAEDVYDSGYDAGYDDGGGFDF